jgi:dTDP-4-amino-4,6-dideoxygalactose transaminase
MTRPLYGRPGAPGSATTADRIAEIIPVYRPLLPAADALRPYLEALDKTRWYSSNGALVRLFGRRLSELLGSAELIVYPAASGTAALVGAILAAAGRASPARPLCLCPAYTFAATASAIEQCGYKLHFVDVDEADWMADPERLARHPLLDQVGLIVPVVPYGRAVPHEAWRRFRTATGVPVAIDAAAGLEAMAADPAGTLGPLPAVLSFQATKAFATGEGGAVVCADRDMLERAAQALNFGMTGARRADTAGINGKMSEYHAAVGLAELDGWAEKRAAFARVVSAYRKEAERRGIRSQVITAPNIASCYVLYAAADADEAMRVTAALDEAGVEHRLWYGLGVHRESYYAAMSRDELTLVAWLAPRLIGLPSAPDLSPSAIARIVSALASAHSPRERAAS